MLSALWLLQLATTGLLLQHADDFGLSTNYVKSPMILQWFDYGLRQKAWQHEDDVFYQIDDAIAFSGTQAKLTDKVVAATKVQQDWLAVSAQSIYRYNQSGELVLQLDSFDGIPTPITQASSAEGILRIKSAGSWFQVSEGGLITPDHSGSIEPIESRELKVSEKKLLFADLLNQTLSYDKVVHGIHSGIKSSKWLNTLSSLALFYLCFSGLYLFFKQPKSKKNQS